MRSVDASVAIDYLRGYEPAGALVDELLSAGTDMIGSEIVRFELLAGVRDDDEEAVERFMAAIEWIPVTEDIIRLATSFARSFRAAYSGIDASDYLIAATASLLDAPLLTRNVRHFPMIPDLQPPY